MHYSVTKGCLLVIGDLHLSDKFRGQHKDYQGTCRWVMNRILDMAADAKQSHGAVSIMLLGDLFGVKEKRFTTREFFLEVYAFFKELNSLCRGNVFSVIGNHDISHDDRSDFEVFGALGMLKVPEYVDFVVGDTGIRVHFLHYGMERETLTLHPTMSNVALGHNDFGLPGQPEYAWYSSNSISLESCTNLDGISLLLSGHIHTPAPAPSYVTMPSGKELTLFYPGSPARVSERYDDCIAVKFYPDAEGITYTPVEFGLIPLDEEFYPKQSKDDNPSKQEDNHETLVEIVGKLSGHTLIEGNILELIKHRPDVSDSVKKISIDLLTKQLNKAK